jgi:3-methyladenine DNA glycosylase AlkD
VIKQYSKYTKEVEDKLYQLSSGIEHQKKEKLKKYIGTQYDVYALDAKTQIEACKEGYSFYSDNHSATFDVFNAIYLSSKNFETINQAFIYLDKHDRKINDKDKYSNLVSWVKKVDNWALSDNLSKHLTRFLEKPEFKDIFISQLQKWNSAKNPWERRQSLVSLFYYSRTKKQHVEFDLVQKHILNLISDSDYFVQKAVGWTLRESYNVYPVQTFKFIENKIKHITSTAFTTSIEKMELDKKSHLKLLRK